MKRRALSTLFWLLRRGELRHACHRPLAD